MNYKALPSSVNILFSTIALKIYENILFSELISLLYFYDFWRNSNLFCNTQINIRDSAEKISDFRGNFLKVNKVLEFSLTINS